MSASVDYFPDRRTVAYRRPDVISRREHLEEFGRDYSSGQHATFIGPTQRGKSRLMKEMLARVISEDLKAIVLMGKPPGRERTWNEEAAEQLGLHVTSEWPPSGLTHLENMRKGRGRPKNNKGWLLIPDQFLRDVDEDDANLYRHFKAALMHAYASTKQQYITVVDEAHQVQVDLKLKKQVDAPLMRGAPDNAVWQSLQRGAWVSMQTYAAPEHVFVFKDKNRDNPQRYGEIGGVDTAEMVQIVRGLKTKRVPTGGTISQAAYFRRADDEIRIVDT